MESRLLRTGGPGAPLNERIDFRTMVWHDDSVVDLVGQDGPGKSSVGLDGEISRVQRAWPYRFDACRSLDWNGTSWSVLYERLGTKALLLKDGDLVKQIDRSYYYAHATNYPIALGISNGRPLIASVADYDELHIDDLETGQRLTHRDPPFRSNHWWADLEFSADGRYLLDRGWKWQPQYTTAVYDVGAALEEPKVLDEAGLLPTYWPGADETRSAALVGGDRLVIIAEPDGVLHDEARADPLAITPGDLGVWDIRAKRWLCQYTPPESISIAPFGELLLVTGEHPALIDPITRATVHEWPEMPRTAGPHLVACDPRNDRLAIYQDGTLLLAWNIAAQSS